MNKIDGFTLIEVLIAGALMLAALLSLLACQANALRAVGDAYWRSVALVQAANMLERLRVNAGSSGRNRAVSAWQQNNKQYLPQGSGQFACSFHTCTVSVQWVLRDVESISLTGSY